MYKVGSASILLIRMNGYHFILSSTLSFTISFSSAISSVILSCTLHETAKTLHQLFILIPSSPSLSLSWKFDASSLTLSLFIHASLIVRHVPAVTVLFVSVTCSHTVTQKASSRGLRRSFLPLSLTPSPSLSVMCLFVCLLMCVLECVKPARGSRGCEKEQVASASGWTQTPFQECTEERAILTGHELRGWERTLAHSYWCHKSESTLSLPLSCERTHKNKKLLSCCYSSVDEGDAHDLRVTDVTCKQWG